MMQFSSFGSLTALRLVFAMNGAGVSVWFPRIPDVKAALGLDLFTLSICLFMLPLGTMLGFVIAPALLARFGARRICLWGGPIFILSFILPALAASAGQLGLTLFAAGLTIASVEIAMNTKASETERLSKRRIMSSCHAFWSIGGMAGALAGGAFAQSGLSFLVQQATLAPLMALAAFAVATRLDPDGVRAQGTAYRFALPPAAVLGLCVLPMGALLLEGAMMEWSALFLRADLGMEPLTAAFVYGGFAVAMAASRLSGDRLAERLGTGMTLSGSAVLATVGIAVFASATTPVVAFLAATTLGLGIANIYPLAVSLAGQVPSEVPEHNIAAVAFVAFTAFLIGPPLVGTLGSWLGLPTALLLLAPAACYPLLMGRILWPAPSKEA